MELQPQTGGISELGQTLKYHNGHNEIWWQRNWGKKSSEHCVYFVMLQTCSIFPSAIANVPSLLPEQAAQSKNMYLKHLSVYEESKHQAGSKAFLFVMNRSRERHRLLLGWQWKFGFLRLRLGKRIKDKCLIFSWEQLSQSVLEVSIHIEHSEGIKTSPRHDRKRILSSQRA